MKLLFAADVSLGYLSEHPQEKKDPSALFSDVIPYFRDCDCSVVNMENVFADEGEFEPIVKSGPNLLASKDLMSYLEALGPTVLNFANNHAGDFGGGALLSTMDAFRKKGIACIGAGRNIKEAYEPYVLRKGNEGVAVIGVCENEFGIATDDRPGAAGYSLSAVTDSIRKAADEGLIPIIYFHGGNEYNPFPSPMKTELYRHFIDLGAAAVIAMHTHCPQGMETYKNGQIVYSMGNFYFPEEGDGPSWYTGYMVRMEVGEKGVTAAPVPYRFDTGSHRLLRGGEREHFLHYLDAISRDLSDKKKIRAYFDAWSVLDGVCGYAHNVRYDDEMLKEGAPAVRHVKNIFGCEAHNELIKNAMQLVYEGRVEEAAQLIPQLKKYQRLEY
ncbi:MAG: CapA family protein [Clostridia bacterium]|nr:CapA family protein [Clostridia bacterium]